MIVNLSYIARPRGYENKMMSMKFYLLIYVKMPAMPGILTFLSIKIVFWAYLSMNKTEFLDIFTLMSM